MNSLEADVRQSPMERLLYRMAALRSSTDFRAVERRLLLVLGQECRAETAELHILAQNAQRIETVTLSGCQNLTTGEPSDPLVTAKSCAAAFELAWTSETTKFRIVLRPGVSGSLVTTALLPVQAIVARYAEEILDASYALAEVEAGHECLRQREALLQATRASLAVSHELGRTGNFRFNYVTHTNWVSEEIFRFLGLDPRETKMTLAIFWAGIHEDDRERLKAETGEAFRNRTARTTHYRTRHPDGTVRYIMTSFRPANDEPDSDFIGTNIDLTDRRAAVERARTAQADLARMLRLATLNELASSLIHGISQPLTAIVASAAAALRWLEQAPRHQEQVKASLAAINRSSDRLKKDVGLLRSLASRAVPEATLVQLDGAIRDVIALAVSEAERRGIVFDWNLGCEAYQVLGDRSQVQQLFLSLATSAFRVADIGCTGERRVSAATVPGPDGHVSLLVAFDASDKACTIFDLSADTADIARGTEDIVDLWLSRTIAESYAGTLMLEAIDTSRKQFVVRLPTQSETLGEGCNE